MKDELFIHQTNMEKQSQLFKQTTEQLHSTAQELDERESELAALRAEESENFRQHEELKDELFILETKTEQQTVLLKQTSEQLH